MMQHWETVQKDNYTSLERFKVKNGWLVRTTVFGGQIEQSISTSLIFMRDLDHSWVLGDE